MGGISVGGGSGARRSVDSEINMVPMIDLLMVTISFLLITAVWVKSSRLEADANVPSAEGAPCAEGPPCRTEPRLHVQAVDPTKFVLAWKDGATVVRSVEVAREWHRGRGPAAFPELSARIAEEWKAAGQHRDVTDRRFDRVVLHTPNDMPYGEVVAIMDAIAKPQRSYSLGGKTVLTSAFETTFATD